MAAAKTAIASTQQQGEGDAFVLQGLSNPINIMAGLKKQKDEGDKQKLLLKNKQEYDTQKSFYDQLTALNTLGIRTIDLPRVNQEIDGLIKEATEAKMQGKNPFDLGNPAEYMNLMGRLSKVQATVDASKTLQKQIIFGNKSLADDKDGKLDQQKGRTLIDYTATAPLEDVLGATINIPLAELKFGEILDKTLGDNIKEQLKIAKEYNDKNMVEEANKIVDDIKKSTLVSAITIGDPYIKDGRISNSDVIKQANDWITQWGDKALYNPNKDEDQAFAEKKQKDLQADRDRRYKLLSDKFQFVKSMSEVKSTEVDDLFKLIADNEPVSAMALAGQIVLDPKTNKPYKTGEFTPIKNKDGVVTGIRIKRYEVDKDGNEVEDGDVSYYDSPIMSKDGKYIYSGSQIYTSKNKTATKDKTPAINYTIDENGDFVQMSGDQLVVGQKKGTGEKTTKSNTKVDAGGTGNKEGNSNTKKEKINW